MAKKNFSRFIFFQLTWMFLHFCCGFITSLCSEVEVISPADFSRFISFLCQHINVEFMWLSAEQMEEIVRLTG